MSGQHPVNRPAAGGHPRLPAQPLRPHVGAGLIPRPVVQPGGPRQFAAPAHPPVPQQQLPGVAGRFFRQPIPGGYYIRPRGALVALPVRPQPIRPQPIQSQGAVALPVPIIVPSQIQGVQLPSKVQLVVDVPPPPQVFLVKSLNSVKPIAVGHDQRTHNFKWSHCLESIGIIPNAIVSNYAQACGFSHDQWKPKIVQLLGKEEYGKTRVHHVMLDLFGDIVRELTQRCQTDFVSQDHQDWLWTKTTHSVVTFIWDISVEEYRTYINEKLYVLLECEPDQAGILSRPIGIRYFSKYKHPRKAVANDSFVEEIIIYFDQEFAGWQKNAFFLYA